MAIKIKSPTGAGLVGASGNSIFRQEVEIVADAESDITALEEIVDDGDFAVIPTPGSIAYTADAKAVYMLSPSGVWTKVGGA